MQMRGTEIECKLPLPKKSPGSVGTGTLAAKTCKIASVLFTFRLGKCSLPTSQQLQQKKYKQKNQGLPK